MVIEQMLITESRAPGQAQSREDKGEHRG
jgi:hypothetical protein